MIILTNKINIQEAIKNIKKDKTYCIITLNELCKIKKQARQNRKYKNVVRHISNHDCFGNKTNENNAPICHNVNKAKGAMYYV